MKIGKFNCRSFEWCVFNCMFEEKNILAEKNFVCSNNLSAVILEEIENCLKEANKKKMINRNIF